MAFDPGPVFVLLVSNAEGFCKCSITRGLFWRMGESGELTSSFWRWLDILDLSQPPAQPSPGSLRDSGGGGAPRALCRITISLALRWRSSMSSRSSLTCWQIRILTCWQCRSPSWRWVWPKPVPQPGHQPIRWLRLRLSYRLQAWIAALLFAFGIAISWFGLSSLSLRLTALGWGA